MSMTSPMTTLTRGHCAPLLNRSSAAPPSTVPQHPSFSRRDLRQRSDYFANPAQQKRDRGVLYPYIRPLATIEPLAIRTGLPVNIKWGMTQIAPLAAEILAAPPGTHVVAWEHHWGEALARYVVARLGGNPVDVPRWEDSDFDSVFVIRAGKDSGGNNRVSFSHEQEALNGMSESCDPGPEIHR